MQTIKVAIIVTTNPELFSIANRMIEQVLDSLEVKYLIDKYVSLSAFRSDKEYTHVFHDGCYTGDCKSYFVSVNTLKSKDIEAWLI